MIGSSSLKSREEERAEDWGRREEAADRHIEGVGGGKTGRLEMIIILWERTC